MPIFTRNKVKQLSGFGYCSQYRYQDIVDYINHINGNNSDMGPG
ncbi:hypothetical protein ACFL6Z_07505 [Pseudomonadota bacterium]